MTHTKVATDRRRRGRWACAAFVAAALLATPVAVTHAVSATSNDFTGSVSTVSTQSVKHSGTHSAPHSAASFRQASLIGVTAPALTPGLTPPHLSSLSDRRIVAGVILVLFAGLGTLTVSMWRELGRRAGL
ncbi:hypothetical protein [Microbaculum sp. FT89]|uniref:hypothetical protein n=1 Tax=Microbaculum sp. FT89 TaxID=3447298 RepID=UPI003F53BEE7